MAKSKIKKIVKTKNIVDDEDVKFRKLVIIFAAMIILCVGTYLLTDVLIEKKDKESSSSSEIEIDYKKILLGDLLNQKENEYYVLIVDFESKDFEDYETILQEYEYEREAIPVYKSNLNDGMNKKYIDEKSNPKASKISELKVSGSTLILIKEKEISGYYEGAIKITEKLK